MNIVVGVIVAAALAPLFLFLFLLIPAIALQRLLRLIAPAPVRQFPMTVDRAEYIPIEEAPRPLELLRAQS